MQTNRSFWHSFDEAGNRRRTTLGGRGTQRKHNATLRNSPRCERSSDRWSAERVINNDYRNNNKIITIIGIIAQAQAALTESGGVDGQRNWIFVAVIVVIIDCVVCVLFFTRKICNKSANGIAPYVEVCRGRGQLKVQVDIGTPLQQLLLLDWSKRRENGEDFYHLWITDSSG